MMTKYYVCCGGLKVVLLANSPKEACKKAVAVSTNNGTCPLLDHFFSVDERGFRPVMTEVSMDSVQPLSEIYDEAARWVIPYDKVVHECQ